MRVARSIAELTGLRAEVPTGDRVGFVATMGALHAGHASLIEQAQALSDTVVVSIFVNPLQFGPGEDYARYPRPVEADLERCAELGVDLVFVPAVGDLYPPGRQVTVSAGTMGTVLEGAVRPGHFDGVLTVVLKLLNLIRPQVVVFGRKDAQQLACVQRMVVDLNLDVRVVGAPTVREPDGLALSSRNVFLSPADRGLALTLAAALEKAEAQSNLPAALDAAWEVLNKASLDPAFVLDYLAAVNPETFAEVGADLGGDVLLVVAAKVGEVRLIDNTTLHYPEPIAPARRPPAALAALAATTMTDLETAASELYALAPEDFVGARTALVKQARAAKDKALADQIGALRKPTRVAWLVNLLARDDPAAIGALLDLGDALRAAQEQRDGRALRELSAQRRKAIDALVRRGTALGREAGHPPTESTLNEVAQTLQAALGDPDVAAQVREARLSGAAVYGGFGGPSEPGAAPAGGDDLAAMLAASMPTAKKKKASPEDEAAERARREAEERRAAAQQARDEAKDALDEAQEAADRATEEADRRAEEVDRLKDELAQAEQAEREARSGARTAREEVRSRRAALDEAEEALASSP